MVPCWTNHADNTISGNKFTWNYLQSHLLLSFMITHPQSLNVQQDSLSSSTSVQHLLDKIITTTQVIMLPLTDSRRSHVPYWDHQRCHWRTGALTHAPLWWCYRETHSRSNALDCPSRRNMSTLASQAAVRIVHCPVGKDNHVIKRCWK